MAALLLSGELLPQQLVGDTRVNGSTRLLHERPHRLAQLLLGIAFASEKVVYELLCFLWRSLFWQIRVDYADLLIQRRNFRLPELLISSRLFRSLA